MRQIIKLCNGRTHILYRKSNFLQIILAATAKQSELHDQVQKLYLQKNDQAQFSYLKKRDLIITTFPGIQYLSAGSFQRVHDTNRVVFCVNKHN